MPCYDGIRLIWRNDQGYQNPRLLGWNQATATLVARDTMAALRKAIEKAGVEFIDENGGGAGVRLRKRQKKKG